MLSLLLVESIATWRLRANLPCVAQETVPSGLTGCGLLVKAPKLVVGGSAMHHGVSSSDVGAEICSE